MTSDTPGESTQIRRQLQLRPDRAPDPLAGDARGKGLPDRATAQLFHHDLIRPRSGIRLGQHGVDPLPQLNLSHRYTVPVRHHSPVSRNRVARVSDHFVRTADQI